MATDVGPSALIKGYIATEAGISYNLNGVDTDGQSKLYASSDMTFEKETPRGSSIINDGMAITFESPEMVIKDAVKLYQEENDASITFENANVNLDDVIWSTPNYGYYHFIGTSSLDITTNSIGETLIKGSQVTGTVTLNIHDGVQDGDTFLIQATDNQLVITSGDWEATPSTSGNITTYTLSKAATPKPKFRMLYTIG